MVRGRGWCGAGGTGGQRLGIRGTGLALAGSANGRRRATTPGRRGAHRQFRRKPLRHWHLYRCPGPTVAFASAAGLQLGTATARTKAAQDCRTPKRKRGRERLLSPKVLECGSPVPLWPQRGEDRGEGKTQQRSVAPLRQVGALGFAPVGVAHRAEGFQDLGNVCGFGAAEAGARGRRARPGPRRWRGPR